MSNPEPARAQVSRARISVDRNMLGALLSDAPGAKALRRQLLTGDFDDTEPAATELDGPVQHRFNAEVVFEGVDGPTLKIPVWKGTPEEALQYVKDAVRKVLSEKFPACDLVYAIGIFGHPYRKGDESLVAERVTLVTPPGSDVPYATGGIVDRPPLTGEGPA